MAKQSLCLDMINGYIERHNDLLKMFIETDRRWAHMKNVSIEIQPNLLGKLDNNFLCWESWGWSMSDSNKLKRDIEILFFGR